MASAGLVVGSILSTGAVAALVAKVLRQTNNSKSNSKAKEQ